MAVAAAAAGLAAALYLSARGMSNLYGDGVAHLNIARKMVDARDPGLWARYVQLGSPWLPLPHLAMLPFVWVDRLWRGGWAGTIPSLCAYVASVWATYRIAFALYAADPSGPRPAREAPAVVAAAALALNPSVLFMASTPMTELAFAALMLASSLAMLEWSRRGGVSRGRLLASALAVAATTLTRYEGWALVPAGAAVVALCSGRRGRARAADVALWAAAAAAGPLFWLWHNWAIYGDALEFLRGPYSARAVFASQASRLGWASFVVGDPAAALAWALLTVAVVAGPVTLALAAVGLAAAAVTRRRAGMWQLPALLPLAPFAFLVVSLFRGEVQIYPLAALALLNVRYGVPYVAAVALLLPAAAPRRAAGGLVALSAAVALQYGAILAEGPSQLAVYQEAARNSRNAGPWRDRARAAAWIAERRPPALALMHAGELGPVVPASGLRFRDLVHEGTAEWGAWAAGGALPAGVRTVVMREGDPVWLRLRDDPELASRFSRVYRAGKPAIEVWETTAEDAEGAEEAQPWAGNGHSPTTAAPPLRPLR